MEDLVKEIRSIPEKKVKLELYYRLNFVEDKSCGYIKVYSELVKREEEDFEIYMEHLECGLTREQVQKKLESVVSDIEEERIDVSF